MASQLAEVELEDEATSEALTDADQRIVDAVDKALEEGAALKRWWEQVDADDAYDGRFELSRAHNRPDTSFGFFGEVELPDRTLDVMGNVQEMFYDRPKTPDPPVVEARPKAKTTARGRKAAGPTAAELNLTNYPQWMRDQVREFVLHYFMRASDFQSPVAYPESLAPEPPSYLKPMAWCPSRSGARAGFGFSQMYYKRADTGEIGKFAEDERFAIVDLRQIGEVYDWIVVRVNIFDFKFTVAPFGDDGPQMVMPMSEASHVVLSREFLVDDSDPGDGYLGRYGIGYAFLRETEESILAYGPGQFEAAFQVIQFEVRERGDVSVRMAFVANRPEKVVDISLDPVTWGFRMADMVTPEAGSGLLRPMKKAMEMFPRPGGVDLVSAYISLANLVTGGMAKRDLCISRQQLERDFLLQHFTQHYNTLAGSLVTWRQIPDWCVGEEELKKKYEWVVTGKG